MKPGKIWLERARFHLEAVRREALDANDESAHWAASVSIKLLDVLAALCERDRLRERRRRLAELRRHKEEHCDELPTVNGIFQMPAAKRHAALDELKDEWEAAAENFHREAA